MSGKKEWGGQEKGGGMSGKKEGVQGDVRKKERVGPRDVRENDGFRAEGYQEKGEGREGGMTGKGRTDVKEKGRKGRGGCQEKIRGGNIRKKKMVG